MFEIRNLADLKRAIGTPGATVTGLTHWAEGKDAPGFSDGFMEKFKSARLVMKAQSGDFALGLTPDAPRRDWWWVGFEKASFWTFDGSDVVVKHVQGDPGRRTSYRIGLSGMTADEIAAKRAEAIQIATGLLDQAEAARDAEESADAA